MIGTVGTTTFLCYVNRILPEEKKVKKYVTDILSFFSEFTIFFFYMMFTNKMYLSHMN